MCQTQHIAESCGLVAVVSSVEVGACEDGDSCSASDNCRGNTYETHNSGYTKQKCRQKCRENGNCAIWSHSGSKCLLGRIYAYVAKSGWTSGHMDGRCRVAAREDDSQQSYPYGFAAWYTGAWGPFETAKVATYDYDSGTFVSPQLGLTVFPTHFDEENTGIAEFGTSVACRPITCSSMGSAQFGGGSRRPPPNSDWVSQKGCQVENLGYDSSPDITNSAIALTRGCNAGRVEEGAANTGNMALVSNWCNHLVSAVGGTFWEQLKCGKTGWYSAKSSFSIIDCRQCTTDIDSAKCEGTDDFLFLQHCKAKCNQHYLSYIGGQDTHWRLYDSASTVSALRKTPRFWEVPGRTYLFAQKWKGGTDVVAAQNFPAGITEAEKDRVSWQKCYENAACEWWMHKAR